MFRVGEVVMMLERCYGRDVRILCEVGIAVSPSIASKTRLMKCVRAPQDYYLQCVWGIPNEFANGDTLLTYTLVHLKSLV